jgi:hypothetical protein
MYVPAFQCFWELERVGRMVDGGKVRHNSVIYKIYTKAEYSIPLQYMCGLPRIQQTRAEKCVIYSFGVAQESSWEAELLQRTECEIYMYDFSVKTVSRPNSDLFQQLNDAFFTVRTADPRAVRR